MSQHLNIRSQRRRRHSFPDLEISPEVIKETKKVKFLNLEVVEMSLISSLLRPFSRDLRKWLALRDYKKAMLDRSKGTSFERKERANEESRERDLWRKEEFEGW